MSMPVYQNLSDNELIAFLREGDAAAYTEVYDRYFQLMFVFAYKKLRDEELAKDFVQELFVRLWERRAGLDKVINFRSYLYVSMRNSLLNHFKHQKVGDAYRNFLTGYELDRGIAGADFRIREIQLADYIELQIQCLPKKMRHIFELSRKSHLSHREIALKLNTSENNVTTQIANALRILKAKLIRILVIGFFL